MNKDIMETAGFERAVKLAEEGLCPFCKKKVTHVRDLLSAKEFRISGLCQDCQDGVFGL